MNRDLSAVITATLVCGTIDIIYAMVIAEAKGRSAVGVLKFVAQGPFGDAVPTSVAAASALGLSVHFAIMLVMSIVYILAMRLPRMANLSFWISGLLYGLLLYFIMYWIVMPLRWPQIFPQTALLAVAEALFAHIVLVGWPMAYIAHRIFRARAEQLG